MRPNTDEYSYDYRRAVRSGSPTRLDGDLLLGASAISEFLFGTPRYRPRLLLGGFGVHSGSAHRQPPDCSSI